MKMTVDYKKRKKVFVITLDAEAMDKLEMTSVMACNRAHDNIDEASPNMKDWARNYYRGFVAFTTPIREAYVNYLKEVRK